MFDSLMDRLFELVSKRKSGVTSLPEIQSEDLKNSTSGWESEWRKFLVLNNGAIIPVKVDHHDIIHPYSSGREFNKNGGLQCRLIDGSTFSVYANKVTNDDQIKSLKRMFVKYRCTELVLITGGGVPIDSPDRLEAVLRYGPEMAVASVYESKLGTIEQEIKGREKTGTDFKYSTFSGEEHWYKFLVLSDGTVVPVDHSHLRTISGVGPDDPTNYKMDAKAERFLIEGGVSGRVDSDTLELDLWTRRDDITSEQIKSIVQIAKKYHVKSLTYTSKINNIYTGLKSIEQLEAILEFGPEMAVASVDEAGGHRRNRDEVMCDKPCGWVNCVKAYNKAGQPIPVKCPKCGSSTAIHSTSDTRSYEIKNGKWMIINEWREQESYGFIKPDGLTVYIPSDSNMTHEEFVLHDAEKAGIPRMESRDKDITAYLKRTKLVRFSTAGPKSINFEINSDVTSKQINTIKSMVGEKILAYDVFEPSGKLHTGYGIDNMIEDLVNTGMVNEKSLNESVDSSYGFIRPDGEIYEVGYSSHAWYANDWLTNNTQNWVSIDNVSNSEQEDIVLQKYAEITGDLRYSYASDGVSVEVFVPITREQLNAIREMSRVNGSKVYFDIGPGAGYNKNSISGSGDFGVFRKAIYNYGVLK
jgi:hypothetical protein